MKEVTRIVVKRLMFAGQKQTPWLPSRSLSLANTKQLVPYPSKMIKFLQLFVDIG